MLVNGIGARSKRASWFATMAVAVCTASVGVPHSALPTAIAQDGLQLKRESDSDSAVAVATDPVLVVTIASLNKLIQDVNYVSAAVGQPNAGNTFTMMAGMMVQGLDPTRPIGVMVPIVDGAPEPIGVIPTADVEMMLKRLEAQTGPVDRLDDGTLVVAPPGGMLIYVRQAGQWAIVARQHDLLDLVPADPMSLMQGMGNSYTLAAQLNVQEIPEDTREALIGQLRQGFEQAMAAQEEAPEGMQSASQDSIKQIEQLIRESERLKIGWNVDPQQKIITVNTEFIAAANTEMAEMYGGQKVIPSRFASVINDQNALFYHAAASLSPIVVERTAESIASLKTMIASAIKDNDKLDDNAKGQVQELANAFVKLLGETIKEGKFDLGLESAADDGSVQLAAGMFVSDGNQAAQLVKDLAAKLQGIPDAPEFMFDEEVYRDVTLHSLKIDIPAKESELRDLFGEQATIKIGTAAKAVYFALGTEPEKSMKSFIDSGVDNDNPAGRPLGQLQMRLLPYLRLAQSIKGNDLVAAVIDALSQNNETAYVSMDADIIENGQTSYFELGEGMLTAIGAVVREVQMQQMKAMQQQGGGQF